MFDRILHLASMQNQTSITNVTDELPSIAEIIETLTFRAGFNTNTVIAGTTMLGLAAGVVGVFALLRKRSLMADALSHATLPGICIAFLVATAMGMDGRSLPVLLLGATVTGVIGVLCIQAIVRYTRLHHDAAIGIVLSVFFGAGVVLLSYIQENAKSSAAGLDHFIYGQAAAMSVGDIKLMAGVAATSVVVAVLFIKEFTLTCFNDSFAKVTGWPVSFIDLLLMALVVVVTVAGLQAVGLIMVVALLIIPSVSARFWTDRLWTLVLLAGLIGAFSGYAGSVMSSLLPRKPAGSVIVLTSGVIFLISMFVAPTRGVFASVLRRFRLRLRIAGEHLLEAAYEQHGTNISHNQIAKLAKLRAWPRWFVPVLIQMMTRQGYLGARAGSGVTVTPQGLARGARVNRNHRLWEQYLVSYADIAPSHVDWSVDQVEHVLTPELVAELESLLSSRGIEVPGP